MGKRTPRRERAASGLQQPLFLAPVAEKAVSSRGAPLFKSDDPGGLAVGPYRLDEYLRMQKMDWVLRLRELLCSIDYSAFTSTYVGTGRRPFHPRALIGLLIYGALKGHTSLRELEEVARVDVGAWWVTGCAQPDHAVLGRFVQKFREFLTHDFFIAATKKCAAKMNVKAGTVGIDGTVIEAAASRFGAMTASKLQPRVDAAVEAAQRNPKSKKLNSEAKRLQHALDVANQRTAVKRDKGRKGEVPVIANEPDAVIQSLKDKDRVRPSYKAILATHESGLIVGQTVESSSETKAVEPLLQQHHAILGEEPKTVLLDAGFFSISVLSVHVERNINVLCPPGKALEDESFERATNGLFPKEKFVPENGGGLRCPAGKLMILESLGSDKIGPFQLHRGSDCAGCPLRQRCTTSKAGRGVRRYAGDELKDGMREVLKNKKARADYRARAQISETPNATLKRRGFERVRRRGQSGARVELAIHVVALNCGKAVGRGTATLLVARIRLWMNEQIVAEGYVLALRLAN